jgi:hypothetical protein
MSNNIILYKTNIASLLAKKKKKREKELQKLSYG